MFPFWDVAIAPILEAVGAKRIVEIGALRGSTTALMLQRLGPEVELHVVDPAPDFDPAEHERQFPGRYIFHRDISHHVLPELPAMDVALIDGDHNWYTVYHELGMLREAARKEGAPFPVLVMHDVGWPYGRRDLYYAPERIPNEFRQPYAQQGLSPGRGKLVERGGGLSPTKNNAVAEGGAHNGVMTALDDFIAEYGRPLRRLVLPIYFGLAIVADEDRLASQPELARILDWLESTEGKDKLLELAESVRIRGMVHQAKISQHREELLERTTTRYLDLLKGALLDEHYLENEVRLQYLADCIKHNRAPVETQLRDPVRHLKNQTARLQNARRVGALREGEGEGQSFLPYSDMGRNRLERLERGLDGVRTEMIGGDLVECGTGRGGGAIFMRGYLDVYEMDDRQLWVADTFRVSKDRRAGLLDLSADLNIVRDGFARFGLLDERVRFLQGSYADTLARAPIEQVALLRIGGSLGESTRDALDALYPKLAVGGIVIVDDYTTPACQQAVDEFRAACGIVRPLERIDWAGVLWRKSEEEEEQSPVAVTAPRAPSGSAPRPSVAPPTSKDLSVVVVFYDMRREAARTLHSLSRAYQQGIETLDYEVIVVENGSVDSEKLGDGFVRSFGPEFRYLDLGEQATPSPADALNRGAALAGGQSIAFMVDGAHVLTPGVLQHGMAGLTTYAPSIAVTQQWYVGPGQQGDQMRAGYDQTYEDNLFDRIEWPSDGYRLFEIGHFIGDRDWLDGLWESNCIFVPRKLIEQAGCFDEAFSVPGGGYANLDFYERIGCTPDVKVVTILGEGSFHQVHGGTTTNEVDTDGRRRRIVSYGEHFADLRGRDFKGPGKTIHYVGSMIPSALRTRARRMTAAAFREARANTGPDGLPTGPSPMPEELRTNFVDAFWHSLVWRETNWLGLRVANTPTDLLAYQELIEQVRPDWVIETGAGDGGRAWFLASICDLVAHGRVLSIDKRLSKDLPQHQRIDYLEGVAHDADVAGRVREMVGNQPHALVVLGSCGSRQTMIDEFEAYEALVRVGSYVVLENTIVNGHPVWPGFGPGPMEAVKRILAARGDFAIDPKMEKYGLTFNPSGYLKRLR
ncbi:MAG: CmcI family methyltransferase [Acidimicrobiia bacterium]